MKSSVWQWLLVAGLALALAGGWLTWQSLHGGPLPAGEVPSVTEVRDDAPLPAFVLAGPKGEFANADLLGRWSFIFFGYTQCPDICPTALTLMKEVKAMLGTQGAAVPPAPSQGIPLRITFQVVFVSVDPRRDTRELLGEYLAAFDPSFIGVSGDDAALAPLTKKLGVYYQRNDGADTKRYTVDHSASIYLIDPQGHLAAVFSPPQTATQLVADYRRIARQ
ncbi:SCO family protein [Sulfuritalea hydrogenivorans]|jgi:protein SCO1/2|uniref:Electron transport protein SCO1/SenC n=1 Tax=Sulfuritalea hydrogenivorans sk43H TaxID=1223802 RepID=W0SK38_9PROT|nr:SCO family protein [Sulfuritalea hydrogenivorans]BAO31095.1 electron transport protein SCO1/SenC [Sulfuritalea hydrogenivorans sk43H]